jgi:hypothetical protein
MTSEDLRRVLVNSTSSDGERAAAISDGEWQAAEAAEVAEAEADAEVEWQKWRQSATMVNRW